MDNFRSSDLLVGNEPLKTKPELGIDPRLVGNRFVSSLDLTEENEGNFAGLNAIFLAFPWVRIGENLARIAAGMALTRSRGIPDASSLEQTRRIQGSSVGWRRQFGARLAPYYFDAVLAPKRRQLGAKLAPRIPANFRGAGMAPIWRHFGATFRAASIYFAPPVHYSTYPPIFGCVHDFRGHQELKTIGHPI